MPGVLLEMEPPAPPAPKVPEYGFVVSHQKLELEVDFATQSWTGRTEITILPQKSDLHEVRIDARQCTIHGSQVTVNGKIATHGYEDPMMLLDIPRHILWTADQYQMQKERLIPLTEEEPGEGALEITIPRSVHIEEVDPFSDNAANAVSQRAIGASAARSLSAAMAGSGDSISVPSALTPKTAAEQSSRFQPLVIGIAFSLKDFRDGLHFVGLNELDPRVPHAYTRVSMEPGTASCIFPCIDDPAMRCTWEISIKCARTLGDALKRQPVIHNQKSHHHTKKPHANGIVNDANVLASSDEYEVPLSEDEKLLEMSVVCSGELLTDVVDPEDSSKKIVSFMCSTIVAPQHLGFAIGPFEQVDLAEFREYEDEEKLGQGQSVPVWGYCLPKRAEGVRHTCAAMAHAVDWFSLKLASFPFRECKLVFVEDQVRDVEHTAGLSLCSSRLLYTKDIIDPEIGTTRILVHAIASQWIGVTVVPNQRADRWVTVGLSLFMTGLFMKDLCGSNDYSFRQKTLTDKLVELDIDRPSIYALGEVLHLGSFEYDFMALKAPLVLFILDKRIMKASSTSGITRVITKIVMGANTGTASESVLSTESFRKLCEKITKYRDTESFWNQWILGAGCPRFVVTHKFNKKKMALEMKIRQVQDTLPTQRKLEKGEFLREFKEEVGGVFAGELQNVFTGPMTIRIHEADGTPYEHIVDIREGFTAIDIPYNTKYKRLKRSRRQKERAAAGGPVDVGAEVGEDALIYCLGDILQSQEEMREWGLVDWAADQQGEMENESFEWIRFDADFEWLCQKQLVNMKSWMFVSQLQQDRDVVAQQESVVSLQNASPHPLVATFLVRTLMDQRYFHGIRTMAAEGLANHATPEAYWVGMRHLEKASSELFCYPGSKTPRSNDFSDKKAYLVAASIPQAAARIRNKGKCPKEARQFVLDQLRFNDNNDNKYSDQYKVANLLRALTKCLLPIEKKDGGNEEVMIFAADDDDYEQDDEPLKFRSIVIEELDRHRRMDEWLNSHHNIYTTTALTCKQKLMKAGVIPKNGLEFITYLHDGTSDFIRIKAFEALFDLGFITDHTVSNLFLNVLSTDSSPYVRDSLFQIFCLGLATVALGELASPEAPPVEADADAGTLVIDQDAGQAAQAAQAARKAYIARTTSIDGALAALKVEMKGDHALKEAIWKAIQSPIITLSEQSDLLDICSVLYDAVQSMIIKLSYPRYWEAKNLGKGQLEFKQTEKVRTKMVKSRKPKPLAEPIVPAKTSIVILHTGSMAPPPKQTHKRPHPTETSENNHSNISSDDQPPRKKVKLVKLKVNSHKVDEILRSLPHPIHPHGSSSSTQSSPAPRPTTTIPTPSPSTLSAPPAPHPAPLPGSLAVKPVRKPLPDSAGRKPLPDSAPSHPLNRTLSGIKIKFRPSTKPKESSP